MYQLFIAARKMGSPPKLSALMAFSVLPLLRAYTGGHRERGAQGP
jgi:hypothetical protein